MKGKDSETERTEVKKHKHKSMEICNEFSDSTKKGQVSQKFVMLVPLQAREANITAIIKGIILIETAKRSNKTDKAGVR